jgi:hypothetical protein
MPAYCQPLVEYSTDPLSDTTPTWQDVTRFVQDVSWFAGTGQDLDAPQNGGCAIVLKNGDRRFEPDYSGSPYYPNVVPLRRFRITVVADGATVRQGIYYVRSWDIDYPGGTTYSTATATCTDGFALLSLYTLPTLTPPTAETYTDVVEADSPWGHWPLDDTTGKTMRATTGPEGTYKGNVTRGVQPNPVTGDANPAALFATGTNHYGRAVPDDTGIWHDSGAVTMEAVITNPGGGAHSIICGPENSGVPSWQLVLKSTGDLEAAVSTSGITNADAISSITTGAHHVCATYDGGVLRLYIDGALVATDQNSNNIVNAGAGGDVKIGGQSLITATVLLTMSEAAVYDYALSAAQVAAHAAAALSRGYTAELTGSRIANIATHPLWSTSNIGTGSYTVAPRMQTGQTKLDEILETVQAEQPFGLFWFDDQGRPAYRGADYTTTIQATFGDSGSDIRYQDITFTYDDALYNTVSASRDNGGTAQTRTDSASVSAYGARGYSADNLILSNDQDVALVAAGIGEHFSQPMFRITSITLNAATQAARTQLLNRDIGDTIRIRRRGDTTTPIDIITRILRKEKSVDVHGNLVCTWSLARGFAAPPVAWRIGQQGFSEIGQTTILG